MPPAPRPMKGAAYEALLGDLCQAIDLADASRLHKEGRLDYRGIGMTLVQERLAGEEQLVISVDLGDIPADNERRSYAAMLESNLLVGDLNVGLMALDRSRQRALLVVRLPFTPALTGRVLGEALTHYAEQAEHWRTHVFQAPSQHGAAGPLSDEVASPELRS